MTDLQTLVGDTYRAMDYGQAPLTPSELMHRAGPVRPLETTEATPIPSTAARRNALVGLAAVAAVVLVVLAPAMFGWFGGTEVIDEPTSTSTTLEASPTTSTPPVTTTAPPLVVAAPSENANPFDLPAASEAGWTWVKLEPSVPQPRMFKVRSGAIVRIDRGWACVMDGAFYSTLAYDPDGALACTDVIDQPQPTIEVSEDGFEWHSTAAPGVPNGWTMSGYTSVVGGYLYIHFSAPTFNDAMWFGTADGNAWFAMPGDEGDLPLGVALTSVPTRNGAIAKTPVYDDSWTQVGTTYFVSTDGGRTYVEGLVPDQIAAHPSTLGFVGDRVEALVWSEVTADGLDYKDPVLWSSIDGVEWQRVGTASGLPPLSTDPVRDRGVEDDETGQVTDFRFGSLTGVPSQMWTLGSGVRITPAATLGSATQEFWTHEAFTTFYLSNDGLNWTPSTSVRPLRGLESEFGGVGLANGWFSVFWEEWFSDRPDSIRGAMTTRDGVTWYRLLGPDGQRLDYYSPSSVGVSGAVYIVTFNEEGFIESESPDHDQSYFAFPPG